MTDISLNDNRPEGNQSPGHHGRRSSAIFDWAIVGPAIGHSFGKLNPRTLIRNPVMFVVEIVAALTTVLLTRDLVGGKGNVLFESQIVFWLWFTVIFANFSEAVAEGRGKAQAENLRRTRTQTQAKRLGAAGTQQFQMVSALDQGDHAVKKCLAGVRGDPNNQIIG